MSLSGTLGSFALPDVLRLLANTGKTGLLSVETERGRGTLAFVDGKLAQCVSPWSGHIDAGAVVLFEMLCAEDGAFNFDGDVSTSELGGDHLELEEVLVTAEGYRREWEEILRVVPSTDSYVALVADQQEDTVTLSSSQWRAVVALSGGASVSELGARLGLGELPTGRMVRDLLKLGVAAIELVENPTVISDAYSSSTAYSLADNYAASEDEYQGFADSWSDDPPSWSDEPPAVLNHREFDDVLTPFGTEPVSEEFPEEDPRGGLFSGDTFAELEANLRESNFGATPGPEQGLVADLQDSNQLARQLANLSPRAAAAVAAVAESTGNAEGEEAFGPVIDDGDDSINRGLLLKFLSNIKE